MTRSDDPRLLPSEAPLEAPLPGDLQDALAAFLGIATVPTLAAFGRGLQGAFGDRAIAVEDLCITDESTPHRALAGEETYRFACFYDAIILAALRETTVALRTASPEGMVIRAVADGGDLTVAPRGAVFSFGIDPDVADPGLAPRLERGYEGICPYVKAFPTFEAYDRWDGSHGTPTVASSLASATDFARLLVER